MDEGRVGPTPPEYPAYETVILTGQMPASRLISFLDENPDFARWYAARAKMRRQRRTDEPS